ncbi:MAG: hypothetical protein RI907_3532 [Pseudomonadota bacterium]|jgi:glycosyltransferase involved in cell wall biosynthesis
MKVLCVAETLGRGGGAEQLIYALAPHFRQMGVEVHYLALFPYADDLGVVMAQQGHQVFRADITRPWQLWDGCRRVKQVVNLDDYDLLWGHLYFGNLYANLLNLFSSTRKTMITLHSEGYAQLPRLGLKDQVITRLERHLCGRAQFKCAVSKAVKQDYEAFFGWSGLDVVHNGVDVRAIETCVQDVDRAATRRHLNVGDEDFFVVVPARFVKKKGHTYLIRAVRRLQDKGYSVKAYFASAQGPEREALLAEIEQLGLASRIWLSEATVPHEQLLAQIKSADAVVIPSLREPFGIAAAEAMACAAPTVLTKVDGFCELVGDSGGASMVAPADVDGLADAIEELIRDPSARMALGRSGQERIRQKFDIRSCAEAWANEFRRAA